MPSGELTALPRPPGVLLLRGVEGKGKGREKVWGEGEGRGEEVEGGVSENCEAYS